MNYYKNKWLSGGSTLILSTNLEKIKKGVLEEVEFLNRNDIPCCFVTYDELCDSNTGKNERTSDLNPFTNIDINSTFTDEWLPYLPWFIACLISIEYDRLLNEQEHGVIKEACKKMDFNKNEIILEDVLKSVQKKLDFPDQLKRFYTKVDLTVETIKNRKDFYFESSDPTILFYNFVHSIISLKKVYVGTQVWIYTDLLGYVASHKEVLDFIAELLSKLDDNIVTINYMVTNEEPILSIDKLGIKYLKRIDIPEKFVAYRELMNINKIQWNHSKVMAL